MNQSVTAQDEIKASKALYAEFGGGGIIMSMNYDQRFISQSKSGLGYRIGVGFGIYNYKEIVDNNHYSYRRSTYNIPVGLNYVFGRADLSSSFEVGFGATFLTRKMAIDYFNSYEKQYGHFLGFLNFMYRRMPVNGGYNFRVGFTPLINASGDLVPMGAVSFGYAF